MRKDTATPAEVREAIRMMTALGAPPVSVSLPTVDAGESPMQLPRPASKDIDLNTMPKDVEKRYQLRYGDEHHNVAALLFERDRDDLGSDPENRAHWIVRRIYPELDTIIKFRDFVLRKESISAPYRVALADALWGTM